jgi:sulfite reductase alpha subunit
MTKALKPGDDRGATILIGGKRALKIGDLMGTVIMPFFKLDTEEDYEKLVEFATKIIEFFADNALEHERIGETIDRIGLPAFLEAVGVDPDPNMVKHPRTSCYVRTDDFTDEAEKYFERKKFNRAAKAGGIPEAAE